MVFRANDTLSSLPLWQAKSLEGIEGDVILGRFENTVAFFNSTDVAVQGIALNEDALETEEYSKEANLELSPTQS
jgi:hypothetical protein